MGARDVRLCGIQVLLEHRPHGLGYSQPLECVDSRSAGHEVQDVTIVQRDHVAVRGEVRIRGQHAQLDETLVRMEDVEIIGEIVRGELPRAIDLPDLRHADELDFTRAAEDDVHVPAHVAEPLLQ